MKTGHIIVEGADHDTPSRLQYEETKLEIPSNAIVVRTEKNRFGLYASLAREGDLYQVNLVEDPFREWGGWPLIDPSGRNDPMWLNWIFEMPRALVTPDGRLYVSDTFLDPDSIMGDYYTPHAGAIIHDALEIFEGRKTIEELNNAGRRTF